MSFIFGAWYNFVFGLMVLKMVSQLFASVPFLTKGCLASALGIIRFRPCSLKDGFAAFRKCAFFDKMLFIFSAWYNLFLALWSWRWFRSFSQVFLLWLNVVYPQHSGKFVFGLMALRMVSQLFANVPFMTKCCSSSAIGIICLWPYGLKDGLAAFRKCAFCDKMLFISSAR